MRGRFASKRENHALICAPGLFVSSGDLPLLADGQSVLQGGRHLEAFNRLLNSVFFIGCPKIMFPRPPHLAQTTRAE